jgi:VanZ family protein
VSATISNLDATLHRLPIEMPIPMIWKPAFIGCAIVFAPLAWLPANAITRTSLSGHAEHLIAYFGAATAMSLAARTTRRLVVQCLLLIGYAAILEAGQLYATGRQASFQDFAFSSSGVLIGAMFVWIARSCWVRVKNLRPTFVEEERSGFAITSYSARKVGSSCEACLNNLTWVMGARNSNPVPAVPLPAPHQTTRPWPAK